MLIEETKKGKTAMKKTLIVNFFDAVFDNDGSDANRTEAIARFEADRKESAHTKNNY